MNVKKAKIVIFAVNINRIVYAKKEGNNMGKTMYMAMKLNKGKVRLSLLNGNKNETIETNVQLPEDSIGYCFVFKTKKAAYKWYNEKVELIEVEIGEYA